MRVPQIRMESTFAQLGLNIEKPVQQIEQPRATLSIEQSRAIMDIKTEKGKLTIDQTRAFNEIGLKNVLKSIEEFAAEGYQAHLEGMSRRARQGDELMRIENGGNPIKSQAKVNGERPYRDLGIKFIPSPLSVDIIYEPGRADVNFEPQRPIIDAQINKPIHEYTPGKVTGYIERYNSLQIDYVNLFDEKM